MADFKQAFEVMKKDFEMMQSTGDTKSYFHLSSVLQDIDTLLREYMQEITEDDINKIIRKLKDGEDLRSDDISRLELWIVGDAESYSKMENNFGDWTVELKRLQGEIDKYRADQPDMEAVLTLRGLLRDTISVLGSMIYFLQQKERIQNFKQSMSQLTPEDKEMLVRLLEQKKKSWDY